MTVIDLSDIILYDDQHRILLQHRTDDAPTFPGYWSFFGGSVEPGETFEEAAIREAYEELSYTLRAPLHWLSQPFGYEGQPYKQACFCRKVRRCSAVPRGGTGHGLVRAIGDGRDDDERACQNGSQGTRQMACLAPRPGSH